MSEGQLRWWRRPRRVMVVLLVGVLGVGGVLSAGVAVAVDRAEQQFTAQVVDRYADDVTADITAEINRYGDTVIDLATGVGAQSDLRADEFAKLATGFTRNRLPGTSSVAFVVAAPTARTATVQALWRAHGAAGLKLTPAGPTGEHRYVIFDRTADGGASDAGQDLDQVPATSAALREAQQSGTLVISAAHVLLRDENRPTGDRQTSIVLAAPVYAATRASAQFRGWVVLGVRMTDFLTQGVRERTRAALRIVLDDPQGAGTTIADVTPMAALNHDAALLRERTFRVGQRTWHLTLYPTAHIVSRFDRWMALIAGGSAGAITLLLAVLLAVLVGSRDRALEQVDAATIALREDITRREAVEAQLREREAQLRHLAFHDPLTGLANRILFYDRVSHALLTHARRQHRFAVLFIDLDGFKQVNDQYGHAAGDTVLHQVSGRLRSGLRDSDTVARFGGDEFAILLENISAPADAHPTADRIVASVQQPIDLGAQNATVTASIGIAVNQHDDSADDILRRADLAMYTAKTTGKSRYITAET